MQSSLPIDAKELVLQPFRKRVITVMAKQTNKKLQPAPIEEVYEKESLAANELKKQSMSFVQKLMKEPKRTIVGSEVYKTALGSVWTFSYNGYPVTLRFDGTEQKYPETIAKAIERKLAKIARSIQPKETNEQIEGF